MYHNFQHPMGLVVRHEVGQLLLRYRDGDVSRYVETIVRLDSAEKVLVGLRDCGREAIVVDRGAGEGSIRAYRVGVFPGGAGYDGVIEWLDGPEAWIDEHREEFCWLHPRWR